MTLEMTQEMTQEEIDKIRRKEQARYAREWRKKNPEKAKAAKDRYWKRKAERLKAESEGVDEQKKD